MKRFIVLPCIMSIFLFSCHLGNAEENRVTVQNAISLEDLGALEAMAEESHAFDTLSVEPPSALMVVLRRIGTPILIAALNVRKKVCDSWNAVAEAFSDPVCTCCNRRH